MKTERKVTLTFTLYATFFNASVWVVIELLL